MLTRFLNFESDDFKSCGRKLLGIHSIRGRANKHSFFLNGLMFSLTVPQIVIMGPPASGKRTISKMVSSKLRTAHLTPENLINDADSDLKTEAEVFVKNNEVNVCRLCHTVYKQCSK